MSPVGGGRRGGDKGGTGGRGSGRGQYPLAGGAAAVTVGGISEEIAGDTGQVGGRSYSGRGKQAG